MTHGTPYFIELRKEIARRGGIFNAHLHMDRSGTLAETQAVLCGSDNEGMSHLSLSKKHGLIPLIHDSPAYDPENLGRRVGHFLDLMEQVGTTRADTVVDVTMDRVGLTALHKFLELKYERRSRFDLRVAAYTPLGFKDSEPGRWELFVEGAKQADFIGALPERDDHALYPDHIGFTESCRRILLLSQELGKYAHIHVDQKNDPDEDQTEIVIGLIDELGLSYPDPEPMIWLTHVISPSTYEESRFTRLVDALAERNVGVICCPSGAISMRQFRPLKTPTGNSIARVLEMLAAGVQVRLGSDNLCDVTSPAGTIDLVDEIFVLANAVRFYDIGILSKLGAGEPLDAADRAKLRSHLDHDASEIANALGAR
jgi:cytosine deaminase